MSYGANVVGCGLRAVAVGYQIPLQKVLVMHQSRLRAAGLPPGDPPGVQRDQHDCAPHVEAVGAVAETGGVELGHGGRSAREFLAGDGDTGAGAGPGAGAVPVPVRGSVPVRGVEVRQVGAAAGPARHAAGLAPQQGGVGAGATRSRAVDLSPGVAAGGAGRVYPDRMR